MAENEPTTTWRNPYWGTLAGEYAKLRPIFESLSNFLARPQFTNGVELGDGTAGTKDETTGVETPPPTTKVTTQTFTDIETALAGLGTTLDDVYGTLATMQTDLDDLETAPIDGTRITDNTIATPKLQANSVTATQLAAMNIGVGKWIASTSYVAGTSGWIIAADGTAEFNNVTVRGLVTASTVQTAATGARVVLTPSEVDRISFYNASNAIVGKIGHYLNQMIVTANSGTVWFRQGDLATRAGLDAGNTWLDGLSVGVYGLNISSSITGNPTANLLSLTIGGTWTWTSAGAINAGSLALTGGISSGGGTFAVTTGGAVSAGSVGAFAGTFGGLTVGGKAVSEGGFDTGGSGYRVLRVPN